MNKSNHRKSGIYVYIYITRERTSTIDLRRKTRLNGNNTGSRGKKKEEKKATKFANVEDLREKKSNHPVAGNKKKAR